MSADELRCRMHHDIRSVLNGTNQVRRTERIVYNQRNPMTMSYLGYSLDINDVAVRVSQRLDEHGFRILPYGLLEVCQVDRIYKGGGDAFFGQCMCQQIVRTSINGFGRHDMVARTGDVLKGVSNGCRPRSYGQCGNSSLKGCHTLFKNILRRVCQPPIDIPRVLQAEAGGSMGRVAEYVRSSLVNGDGARIRRRVGLFLSYMKL